MGARLPQEICTLHLRLRGEASAAVLGAGGVGKHASLDNPSLPRQAPVRRRPAWNVSGVVHCHYREERRAVDGYEVRCHVLKHQLIGSSLASKERPGKKWEVGATPSVSGCFGAYLC